MNECPVRASLSLLLRIQADSGDQAAWSAFVDCYGPCIYSWCRRWNLQEADAQDVTQEVLVQLVHKLRHFTYDPSRSFRGWLKTLAHHAWRDSLRRRRRAGLGSGDADVLQQLQSVAARDDLEKELHTAGEREVLDRAMTRVRQRVAAHTWEAFRLLTFERLGGAEVARRVGMKVAMVYAARCKVQQMLRQEVVKLEGQAA